MPNVQKAIIAALCLAAISISCEKGRDEDRAEYRALYRSLVNDAVELYTGLHPLRSSRLGNRDADSLLFSFSGGDIAEAGERIEDLISRLEGLRPQMLDRPEVDNSRFLLHWLKGESFALNSLQPHRHNPLLYCWMAEEALFGIPSRPEEPPAEEITAYTKRVSALPGLLDNAENLLEAPSPIHIRLAVDWIGELLTSLDALEGALRARYGADVREELGTVRGSLEEFRSFLEADLAPRARGRQILGAYNLSQIFLYDELLDLDPNRVIEEAEKSIRLLASRLRSLEVSADNERIGLSDISSGKAPEPQAKDKKPAVDAEPVKEPAAGKEAEESTLARLSRLLREIESRTAAPGFKSKRTAAPEITMHAWADYCGDFHKNAYLTIPTEERRMVKVLQTTPFSRSRCSYRVLAAEGAPPVGEAGLIYDLITASETVCRSGASVCESGDYVRTILRSATFNEAWKVKNTERLIEVLGEWRNELSLRLLEEEIRALARTVIVFRLHSGSLTTEQALEFMVSSTGISREEAESDVHSALVSPSIAYRGIAVFLCGKIAKKLSSGKGNPLDELLSLLYENNQLPLPMILERITNQ